MASLGEEEISAASLRGIGDLSLSLFLCQATALLISSFRIFFRACYFSLCLLLKSLLIRVNSRTRGPIGSVQSRRENGASKDQANEPLARDQGLQNFSRGRPDALSSLEIYEGTLIHARKQPVAHRFSYSVRMALFNLDDPPKWFQDSELDHISADKARDLAGTDGPVFLLTNPTSLGYEQNPISVYYCYSNEGSQKEMGGDKAGNSEGPGSIPSGLPPPHTLSMCLAEVTNTPWGDRVLFSFSPGTDSLAKPMHVSPFMDMRSDWRVTTPPPGDSLNLTFDLTHPKHGSFFVARLSMRNCTHRVLGPPSEPEEKAEERSTFEGEKRGLAAQRFFWLMPHKVAFWIYWQALVLWWKGVPLFTHPKYSSGRDYRLDPMERDASLGLSGCCWVNGRRVKGLGDAVTAGEGVGKSSVGDGRRGRLCAWIDSKERPWGKEN